MNATGVALDIEHFERLPIFPLPRLVFFPNTLLPLHIFEQRYRDMIAFCLEEDWPLAITRIRPGHEQDQPGDPPFDTIMGVGHIVHHTRLDDGRYNVLLQGSARVRCVEEITGDEAFRRARVELLHEHLPDLTTTQNQIQQLMALLRGIAQVNPSASEMLTRGLVEDRGVDAISDRLASLLFREHTEKQALLEELNAEIRMQQCLDRLAEILVDMSDVGVAH